MEKWGGLQSTARASLPAMPFWKHSFQLESQTQILHPPTSRQLHPKLGKRELIRLFKIPNLVGSLLYSDRLQKKKKKGVRTRSYQFLNFSAYKTGMKEKKQGIHLNLCRTTTMCQPLGQVVTLLLWCLWPVSKTDMRQLITMNFESIRTEEYKGEFLLWLKR